MSNYTFKVTEIIGQYGNKNPLLTANEYLRIYGTGGQSLLSHIYLLYFGINNVHVTIGIYQHVTRNYIPNNK